MTGRGWRQRLLVVGMVAILIMSACGEDAPVEAGRKVDPSLVPNQLLDGKVLLVENTDASTRQAFADTERSLIADGRLWELRRADQLVGTLQVSTLLPKVDLADGSKRDTILNDVLVGERTSSVVGDVEVFEASSQGRHSWMWFGADMFNLLSVQDTEGVDSEALLLAVLEHQARTSSWVPLPEAEGRRRS